MSQSNQRENTERVQFTEAQWRERLSMAKYRVLREKGTEAPGTGELYHEHRAGMYVCGGCGNELFDAKAKFESGSGWPSFTKPVSDGNVDEVRDMSHGMIRTEVECSKCGSHLGHVFPDGPTDDGGMRYCINSLALEFEPKPAK